MTEGEKVIVGSENFLVMLAHELRQPLSPIRSAIHVLQTAVHGGNIVRNSINILDRQITQITETINDLFDIIKIANGNMILKEEKVELGALIREIKAQMSPAINARKIIVNENLPEDFVWVKGDHNRLRQIVRSLVMNAIRFTETSGAISISMVHDEKAVINIKDTGVGMPPETAAQIFNLYNQPDHVRNLAAGGGLGVNLMLVRELTTLHGGTVEVSSEEGSGSEFTLVLPTVEGNYDDGSKTGKYTLDRPISIVVVDDHPDTAESAALLLRICGHTVHVAHSGPAAVEIVKKVAPDAVLMDIGLPGFDGCQAASQMKSEFPNIILIAVSGYGDIATIRRSQAAGFARHLVKPVDNEDILEVLSRCFQERNAVYA